MRRHRKALEGMRRHRKALEGMRRHRKALEGIGRHRKALEGIGRHWKALEGTGRHPKARRTPNHVAISGNPWRSPTTKATPPSSKRDAEATEVRRRSTDVASLPLSPAALRAETKAAIEKSTCHRGRSRAEIVGRSWGDERRWRSSTCPRGRSSEIVGSSWGDALVRPTHRAQHEELIAADEGFLWDLRCTAARQVEGAAEEGHLREKVGEGRGRSGKVGEGQAAGQLEGRGRSGGRSDGRSGSVKEGQVDGQRRSEGQMDGRRRSEGRPAKVRRRVGYVGVAEKVPALGAARALGRSSGEIARGRTWRIWTEELSAQSAISNQQSAISNHSPGGSGPRSCLSNQQSAISNQQSLTWRIWTEELSAR